MIFQTHNELTVDADQRLVQENMPGAKGAMFFLHDIRPLLHIKSDTVFVLPAYFALHNDEGCCFFDLECGVDIG